MSAVMIALDGTARKTSKNSKVVEVVESGCQPLSSDNSLLDKSEKSGSVKTGERYTPKRTTALSDDHEALLATFLAEETARGRRPRGVDFLRSYARKFLRFLDECGKRAEDVTLGDAYAYQGSLIEGGATARTIAGSVQAAGVFCDWLLRAGKLLDNPFAYVRRVRQETRIPDGILKEHEMDALLAELRKWGAARNLKDASRRYRTHVIAELQYASGLRIAEVADLTERDVDVERALVYVRNGKHGSVRMGFLTDYAAHVLELYVHAARPVLANRQRIARADKLFFAGHQWLHEAMNKELARACTAAGVPVITSHGFRHALGYHLLRAGCALRYIQAILGHKNIKDTEVYTHVDVQDMKAVFDTCHPRGGA